MEYDFSGVDIKPAVEATLAASCNFNVSVSRQGKTRMARLSLDENRCPKIYFEYSSPSAFLGINIKKSKFFGECIELDRNDKLDGFLKSKDTLFSSFCKNELTKENFQEAAKVIMYVLADKVAFKLDEQHAI